ncbi:MAG: hypothetical protein IKO01_10580 [Kiritimatiellae bacterium]|nr:hypothetical protein [Kiritimatiellia bacterium]
MPLHPAILLAVPVADTDGYGGLVIIAVWIFFGLLSAFSKKKKRRRSPSQIPTPPGGFDPEDAPPGAPTASPEPTFVIHDEEPAPEPTPPPATRRPPPFPTQRRVRIPRHPAPAPAPAPSAPPPAFTPAPPPAPSPLDAAPPDADAPVVTTRQGERHILDTSAAAAGLVLPSLHAMNVPFAPWPVLPTGNTRPAPAAVRPAFRTRDDLRRAILAREILRPRNP